MNKSLGVKQKPLTNCMDISGSLWDTANKPPWETIEFLQSPPIKDLPIVDFVSTWSEIEHTELNMIKSKIEPLEADHVWEALKKKTNPYELIYTQEDPECPPSLSVIKPLSRSYFKMIEMLSTLNFFETLNKGIQRISSAHVAEGPGGFVEAFLDQASYRRLFVSRVLAMTLKPTNNHVPGWRRTHSYLKQHNEIKIHYGEDGTGDLYIPENQQSFIRLCDEKKVNLFTGDGGFDFSVDYEQQEKSVFRLLIASASIGLKVLAPDGSFILKFFDLFSPSTQLLIRLITICFKEWTLYKPATSRPCNSERYLLCRGFRRITPEIITLLNTFQEKYTEDLFPDAGPFPFFTEKERDFLQSHITQHNATQIRVLKRTIQLHAMKNHVFKWDEHYRYAREWCSKFRIPMVPMKI